MRSVSSTPPGRPPAEGGHSWKVALRLAPCCLGDSKVAGCVHP